MNPFFSIVTPVYNNRKYIRKCIQSVLDQTYTSWELILVDDGSTDSSEKICDEFCYDSRIRVFHQKNQGALKSRIKGLNEARGQYELGLDADDYFDEKCLETIKKAIDISGSDLIFFGYRLIGKQRGAITCTLKPNREYTQKEILSEVIENTNHTLWNKAIRMEVVKKAKYYVPKKKLSINLDYAQIIPILININTGYVIDDILYNYRIYGSSTSNSCKVQHIFDTGIVTKNVIYTLQEAGLMNRDLYQLVYAAYLKMIGFRLLRLFKNKRITKEDCKKIHQSTIYKNARRVETLRKIETKELIVLKLFRYRQYWMIRLMAELAD